jgi:hypothetical protein
MDYHVYCIRSQFLRAHHDMLATNQAMRQHSNSIRAATALARCYLTLHLQPELRVVRERPPPPPPKEKEAKDGKKEEKKEEDAEEKKAAFDPWGVALLTAAGASAPSPTHFLDQARKYARIALEGIPASWRTILTVELARTQGKVPTGGCLLDAPQATSGVRAGGWRSGMALLAHAALTAAEVEVQAGKAGQASTALRVALAAVRENPAGAYGVPGGEGWVELVKGAVVALAAGLVTPGAGALAKVAGEMAASKA